MKTKFNIDYALSDVVKIKNNSFSRIIGTTPKELFFKIFTEEEIKHINDKMLESQKSSNIYRSIYNINEKVLINDNFILENKTIKRKNKKYGKWVITGIIIKAYSSTSYKIRVTNNFKDLLKKNDEYYTNITMIKKIDENAWKKINCENQELHEKRLLKKYNSIKNEDINDYYSSADNSEITDSAFGVNEDEEAIISNIKNNQFKNK